MAPGNALCRETERYCWQFSSCSPEWDQGNNDKQQKAAAKAFGHNFSLIFMSPSIQVA